MSRAPKPKPLIRFVYVIGPQQGLQKIGLATDPQSRLAALQTASPFELQIHAVVAVPFRDAHAIERRAHQTLARTRVRNEWFDTSPAEAVAAVQSAAAPFKGRATPLPEPAAIWPPVSQWRISRTAPPAALPTDPAPLMQFGAARVASASLLPLFEFKPAPTFRPDTPLNKLGGFRLEVRCCAAVSSYPLPLLASSLPQGGRTALAAAIGLFRCERCRKPVREAVLVEQGAGSAAWRVEVGEALGS